MGASAARLDFARAIPASTPVLIWAAEPLGPQRPPNVLFLFAAGDPERVKTRTAAVAEKVFGEGQLPLGETRGDFHQGTAVRRVEIPGADHATIIWSDLAFSEIVAWLDAAFGREPGAAPASRDPRGPVVALLAGLMALVLPGLGLLSADSPRPPSICRIPSGRSGWCCWRRRCW
jgi:hypothetical protein